MNERLLEFVGRCTAGAYAEPASELHTELSKDMWKRCKDRFTLPPHAVVLDLGCGSGHAMKMFEDEGFVVCGVTCLEQEAEQYAGPSDIVCLDIHNIGKLMARYDLVWARHILEHSPIPAFVLQEIYNIMKIGGYLYVECPMPDTDCRHETGNVNHWSVLTKSGWQQLIQRAGFKVIEGFSVNFAVKAGDDEYAGFICQKN